MALHFGGLKIYLHPLQAPFSPHAVQPVAGSADLCFLLDSPLDAALARLLQCGVAFIEGPVARTGAQGPHVSISFCDPDGNQLELAFPGP